MKRTVLFLILLILVSFGFFSGSFRADRKAGQNAVIPFSEYDDIGGNDHENEESYCLDSDFELPADSLCGQIGRSVEGG